MTNGAGLKNLAKQIVTPEERPLLFVEDSGAELEYPIPKLNGNFRCKECGSKESWSYVDHEWNGPENDFKWVSFRCEGKIFKDCGTYYNGPGHPIMNSASMSSYSICNTVIRLPLDESTRIKE